MSAFTVSRQVANRIVVSHNLLAVGGDRLQHTRRAITYGRSRSQQFLSLDSAKFGGGNAPLLQCRQDGLGPFTAAEQRVEDFLTLIAAGGAPMSEQDLGHASAV